MGEEPMECQALRGPDEGLLAGAARYFGPSAERLLQSMRELVEAAVRLERKTEYFQTELKEEFAQTKALLISLIRSTTQLSDEEIERQLRDMRESSRRGKPLDLMRTTSVMQQLST
jgi:hypothetical protein